MNRLVVFAVASVAMGVPSMAQSVCIDDPAVKALVSSKNSEIIAHMSNEDRLVKQLQEKEEQIKRLLDIIANKKS